MATTTKKTAVAKKTVGRAATATRSSIDYRVRVTVRGDQFGTVTMHGGRPIDGAWIRL